MRSDVVNLSECGEYSYYHCRWCTGCRNYEGRCKYTRRIYYKALHMGPDLLPCDVVDIINSFEGKSEKINWSKDDKYNLLVDVYTSCGFELSKGEAIEDDLL